MARMKSLAGIAPLLLDGIGDTIRVSLTEDSVHEIAYAKELIASVRPEKASLKKQDFGQLVFQKETGADSGHPNCALKKTSLSFKKRPGPESAKTLFYYRFASFLTLPGTNLWGGDS